MSQFTGWIYFTPLIILTKEIYFDIKNQATEQLKILKSIIITTQKKLTHSKLIIEYRTLFIIRWND